MRGRVSFWILLGFLILPLAFADTDHGGLDWNITSDTNASGYHYNIRDVILQPGINLTISSFNGTNDTGWLRINSTRTTYLYGRIIGDGRGGGGGSGGGGAGGNDGDGSFPSIGTGGMSTNQNGTNGTDGGVGNIASCDAGAAGAGGLGGDGHKNISGGSSAGTSNSCNANRNGNNGNNAPQNNDSSPSINGSMGYGGGGGAGGTGGARQSGNDGGGGAGGGMGGDGGAYLVLISRNAIISNGSFYLRAGQDACGPGADGNTGVGGDGYGGNGASNTLNNCAASLGGTGGASLANGGTGGNGGIGGSAAGGMIVMAAHTINLSGAKLNVSGSSNTTNGTIKLLYRSGITANGTYDGYSSLVLSNYSDPWFTNNAISWQQNITSINVTWNSTFFLDLNATNSNECNVSNYTSNDTLYTINSTTGIVTWLANFSRVGNRTVLFRANDTCTNIIDQAIPISVQYHTPNISTVVITPSPTGTASPLICTITINNPDGSAYTNTTAWYRNGTLQPGLANVANVSIGNLTLGDHWICQYNGTDTRTTLGPMNSTTLTLGDNSTPTINSFNASDTTAVTQTGTILYTVNCTDTENIGSVKIEITEPSTAKTNYTASSAGGDLYTYNYPVPGTAGNYTARAYCTDGSKEH